MSVAVVIVAAGRGERLGSSRPKQLLDLAGRTMLQRSVAAFDVHPAVRSLVVVLPEELVAEGASHVGPTTRPCRCVAGGVRRQDSVGRGLAAVEADAEFVLVHDAARPFVSRALIDRVLAAAAAEGAAVPALPVHETVKRAAPGGRLVSLTIGRC
jgi:2-C-methyl-D-erythritol 4-phosphate cytidylyltransferase/2-C-methyl-D-erythritol 2,4-cyclodiphosphate synthase